MYPDLSYILNDFFGTPTDNAFSVIKTFGLLLALAFITSAWLLSLDFKRMEKLGIVTPLKQKTWVGKGANWADVFVNGLIGYLLGFKIAYIYEHFTEFQANASAVLLSSKGNLIAGIIVGLLFAVYAYYVGNKTKLAEPKEVEQTVYPYQKVGDITIVAAVSGLIGARLFSILENLGDFFRDPMGQLFSGSGLTMYGGLILAFFTVFWYVNKLGIKPIRMMDAAAAPVMMGYAVGRLGCQLSGDGDWGIPNPNPKPSWMSFLPDWLWSFSYPHNVAQEGSFIENCKSLYCQQLDPPVFPTPLYESIACFIIVAILWQLRHKIKIAGMLFFVFLIFNGVERFLVEQIRVNPRYNFLGSNLSQAQIIALSFIVIGIIGCWVLWNRAKKKEALA